MLMNKTSSRPARGFSLIELLVVLVILGLLAGLVGPRVMKYLGGAKSDSAKLQIENLGSALDLYRLEVGRYPTTGPRHRGPDQGSRRRPRLERPLPEKGYPAQGSVGRRIPIPLSW